MTNLDGDPLIGGSIDIDRVIIDPDYRRAVMALLRRTPSSAEPGTAAPAPADAPPAAPRPG